MSTEIRTKIREASGELYAADAEALLGAAKKPLQRLANLNDATLDDIAAARTAAREARTAIVENRKSL